MKEDSTGARAKFRRVRLFLHTARYLRAAQIRHRMLLRTRAALSQRWPGIFAAAYGRRAAAFRASPPRASWRQQPDRPALHLIEPLAWQASLRRQAAGRSGRFTFLNVERELGRPITWRPLDVSRLWRYHLQYGRVLVEMVASGPDTEPDIGHLIHEWITSHPFAQDRDAWHPYVVSERVVNWTLAIQLSVTGKLASDERILRSLAFQTSFIAGNLEADVGGNHLLKNLKALAVSACFWQGRAASRHLDPFLERFALELDRQILRDGAHYERSPMYHLLVLEDALEVVAACRASGRAVPSLLVAGIRRMLAFIPVMTHPDGAIALFNDSVLDEAAPPSAIQAFALQVLDDQVTPQSMTVRLGLLAAAQDAPLRVDGSPASASGDSPEEDSGLVRLTALGSRGLVIADFGRACPDDLPAHAHADFFSFELSLDGIRLIVDSGVGEYEAGAWREYYRSTRAHNTVAVDGQDQIECWGSFRVARRARVLHRHVSGQTSLERISACHDGYRALKDPVLAWRSVVRLDDRAWLFIDELEGAGHHRWQSFLHAAPGIDVRLFPRHARFGDEVGVTATWFGGLEAMAVRGIAEPRQGWHAPGFGRHLPVHTVVLSGSGPLPAVFGYVLVPGGLEQAEVTQEGTGFRVLIGQRTYSVSGHRGQLAVA